MEIERKYLIKEMPDNLESYTHHLIEQAYICTSPVIRIRKWDDDYILTVKSSGMLVHQEFELPMEQTAYEKLLTKSEGNVITKCRYKLPLDDGLTLELDVFHGLFEGLIFGEIEFPDEETANKYNPPAMLGREVTFDTHFHNSSMSKMTMEEISYFLHSLNEKQ